MDMRFEALTPRFGELPIAACVRPAQVRESRSGFGGRTDVIWRRGIEAVPVSAARPTSLRTPLSWNLSSLEAMTFGPWRQT
jgi:hypothetical protein